jgi:excinuclease ABC subunit A
MAIESIIVKGAKENNLKNIDVVVPRDKLVVITGVSGSGKSSLAFDTIYAEGQRRYVESLSAYARQFLGRMEKPNVESIEGLSPAISIDQKGVSNNPRSTVGTVTEIYDYLRLLYARIGTPHCPKCGKKIENQTVQQIVDLILAEDEDTRLMVMAPMVTRRKGEHLNIFEDAKKNGFVRVRVNGEIKDLSDPIKLNKQKWHTIEIIVDRLVISHHSEDLRNRISDSVETALGLGDGVVKIVHSDTDEEFLFSEHFACVDCGISIDEIEPRTFSFNNPQGACPECTGLGYKLEIESALVVPDRSLSILEGAVSPWSRAGTMAPWYKSILTSAADLIGADVNQPFSDYTQPQSDFILFGQGSKQNIKKLKVAHRTRSGRVINFGTKFEGVIPNLERRHRETTSDRQRREIERFMVKKACLLCEGKRLSAASLAVTIGIDNINDVTKLSIARVKLWVEQLQSENTFLSEREKLIAEQILKEIYSRLEFLVNVGLEYLTLDRTASTLSGGESQRIRLATQIGSGLVGVLYICDEPSIGLHPVDNQRLIETLKTLRDIGNTVIVVEHDEAVMRAADHIIDIGPGAGEHGGNLVAEGDIDSINSSTMSVTGAYLSGQKVIPVPFKRRKFDKKNVLKINNARANNLKKVDVSIPLGILTCITGVSGSGKSTLINEVLYKNLAQKLYKAKEIPGLSDGIEGIDKIDKVINIDQSPIGRTPRSNPATYVGAFTPIRQLFASVPESRVRGYKPGRFSFNVKGGRCETCSGEGYQTIEMQFLPDVIVPCEVCVGARYNREALEIKFKDLSIADILDLTVEAAVPIFEAFPAIFNRLKLMSDVGLGYMRLGQPATTLSGGEAQRVKLATELSKRPTGRTLYILDEPTTGLAFSDAHNLLDVLHRLVDVGNTVLLIEHHLDLIKNADWIIDLGPGPGDKGGGLVAEGTPEDIVKVADSYTGQYLKDVLNTSTSIRSL